VYRPPAPLPRKVLILGATSAMAIAVARRVCGPESSLYLVARSQAKLDAVAGDLRTRGAGQVWTATMDLNETSAHAKLLTEAAEALGHIDLALIAHGVLGDQEDAQASYTVAEDILATNFLSPVSLSTWLANYFEARGAGTLAVISSVAGDRGRKSNYVYGASKGGLSIFLDGLRNRVDRSGVQVLTIRPGFVATPMTAHLRQGPLFAQPTQIADGILRAIVARRDVVYLPWVWQPIMFLIRAIPEPIFKKMNL
jgi:decaprenylphospho-beta-D-erythro-pentofuranosid-2-ulose 2-reductase